MPRSTEEDKTIVFRYKYVPAILNLKGTVSVISSDLPFKDGFPRFPTVPFKTFPYLSAETPVLCL